MYIYRSRQQSLIYKILLGPVMAHRRQFHPLRTASYLVAPCCGQRRRCLLLSFANRHQWIDNNADWPLKSKKDSKLYQSMDGSDFHCTNQIDLGYKFWKITQNCPLNTAKKSLRSEILSFYLKMYSFSIYCQICRSLSMDNKATTRCRRGGRRLHERGEVRLGGGGA